MIEHLRGRDRKLEPLGWTGQDAEWIALVCLHSGVFTRAQFCDYFDTDQQARAPIRQVIGGAPSGGRERVAAIFERGRKDHAGYRATRSTGRWELRTSATGEGQQAGCHAAAFVAGFCAGASRYELAPRRAGEGRVF